MALVMRMSRSPSSTEILDGSFPFRRRASQGERQNDFIAHFRFVLVRLDIEVFYLRMVCCCCCCASAAASLPMRSPQSWPICMLSCITCGIVAKTFCPAGLS